MEEIGSPWEWREYDIVAEAIDLWHGSFCENWLPSFFYPVFGNQAASVFSCYRFLYCLI